MNIAILGTRGIPNNYGGFEQFAEFLSVGLVERGHRITVYSSSNHDYKKKDYKGVIIKHIYDPEDKVGTVGQFIYDFFSILDTRDKKFDVILQLGYTSSSVFYKLHPKTSIIVTNMDGLEWKRTKYSKNTQKFLQWAESLAVKNSNYLVSDSVAIQKYIEKKYNTHSRYIPYGATLFSNPQKAILKKYNLVEGKYNLLIARLEPENNIEMILDGFVHSVSSDTFIVIGGRRTEFAKYLQKKYLPYENIRFLDGVYDISVLNNLRFFCRFYFHGHSVGGTNPSLLEAMASSALICAHENEFNRAILGDDAFYFSTIYDVAMLLKKSFSASSHLYIQNNRDKILKSFQWSQIIELYEDMFLELINQT